MTNALPWPPPTLDQWITTTLEDPGHIWWLDKLIPADSIILVSGDAKLTKKTLSVCQMVRCLVTARSMSGVVCSTDEPCRVAMLEYEGPAVPLALNWDWMDKGAGWIAARENITWAHRYSHIRLTDPQWADRLVQLIKQRGCKGLVVDTFTRAAMAPENDTLAMSEAFTVLDRLRTATEGGWIIYVHHLRKASNSWDEDIDVQVRGNSAFAGAYDHHLGFRPGFCDTSVHLYTRSKLDQDRFFRWEWRISKEDEQITFRIVEFEVENPPPAGLIRECYELIEDSGVRTLLQLGELWDVPRRVAQWLVDALLSGGWLEKTARGFRKVG